MSSPISIIDCCKKCLTVFFNHFWFIFIINLLPFILFISAGFLIAQTKNYNAAEPVAIVIVLVSMIGTVFANLLLMHIFNEAFDQQPIEILHLMERSLKSFFRYWLAGMVYYMLVFIGSIFLIIPGIWAAITFSMASYAVVLKEYKIWDALSYSKKLIEGNFWKLLAFLAIFLMIAFVSNVLYQFLPGLALILFLCFSPLIVGFGTILFRTLEAEE